MPMVMTFQQKCSDNAMIWPEPVSDNLWFAAAHSVQPRVLGFPDQPLLRELHPGLEGRHLRTGRVGTMLCGHRGRTCGGSFWSAPVQGICTAFILLCGPDCMEETLWALEKNVPPNDAVPVYVLCPASADCYRLFFEAPHFSLSHPSLVKARKECHP